MLDAGCELVLSDVTCYVAMDDGCGLSVSSQRQWDAAPVKCFAMCSMMWLLHDKHIAEVWLSLFVPDGTLIVQLRIGQVLWLRLQCSLVGRFAYWTSLQITWLLFIVNWDKRMFVHTNVQMCLAWWRCYGLSIPGVGQCMGNCCYYLWLCSFF